jgi:hypothetical protein
MQNIGIAFVTLLIPLVLFIFEKENMFEWDKIVILDKVINAKLLIISFGLIFFPLFLWNYDSYILKFVLFIFYLSGVTILINILFNSYRWIKTIEIKGHHDSDNFRNILRNTYLQEVTNLSEKEKVWSLTWRNDIPNLLEERNFIQKFIINIDTLVSSNSFDMVSRYLQTFTEFVEKRALYDRMIFKDVFSEMLELHFLFYKKEEQWRDIDVRRWSTIYEIEANLTRLINMLVLSSLQKANSFSLFKILREHINGKDVNYLKPLFEQSICSTIFENVADSNERYNIWNHYFPQEWKITKETLEDDNNVITRIWLDVFFNWAPNRIMQTEEGKDFDESLDVVAKELFPSVDPILWAKILTFLFTPWQNNLKSLVERRPIFGLIGRPFVSWDSGDETEDNFSVRYSKAIEATLELALILFSRELRKENIQIFINDLKKLMLDEETIEESRRKSYISTFEKMISLLGHKES